MACYRNEARGARTIRKRDRSVLLVEPGETVMVESRDVAKLAPDVVKISDEGDMPDVPEDLAAAVAKMDGDGNGLPGGSKAPPPTDELKDARAAYQAKMGKKPFPGWDAAELQRRMGDA